MASAADSVTDELSASDDDSDEGLVLEDDVYQQTNATDDDIDGFTSNLKTKLRKVSKFFSPVTETLTETTDLSTFTSLGSRENLLTNETGAGDSDTDIYNFNHCHRGLAVIINNELFQCKKDEYADRPGSTKDANSLVKTMKHLGFHVFLQENLTALKIITTLNSVSKDYNHSLADCFVCVILSHGHQVAKLSLDKGSETIIHEDVVVGVDGRAVATRAILEYFYDKNCPDLQGKPKLFFFQACRGSKVDDGVSIQLKKIKKESKKNKKRADTADCSGQIFTEVEENIGGVSSPAGVKMDEGEDQHDAKSEGNVLPKEERETLIMSKPAPLHKDFLVMYATPPGYYSWRRPTGTWFIQSLCKVLNKPDVRRRSLTCALTQVSCLVAEMYESCVTNDADMHKKKEMPVFQSMLIKEVIFSRKHKRGSLMKKIACT